MSAKLNALRRCQLPPVLLAVLLQIAPAVHWFTQQISQPGGLIAIVVKIGGISAALLGGAQAVSGATTVSSTSPPTGGVGIAYNYRLTTAGQDAETWTTTTLPPGLQLFNQSFGVYFIKGTPTTAGTYPVTLTAWRYVDLSRSDNESVSGTVTITITNVAPAGVAPSISTAPKGQRRLPGTNATFSIVATGTAPLKYQWRKDGSNLSGETNATVTFTNLAKVDGGIIVVVVTNGFGAITSPPVNLLIAGRPTITNGPLAGALRFQFPGETGVVYRVESSPTVDFTTPTTVTNVAPSADGLVTLTNSMVAGTNSFFRLRLLSP